MEDNFSNYALLFKALSDETRLRIIAMLDSKELCACNILEAFDITQPTLSYHMRILTKSGIVNSRKNGSWMHYSLDKNILLQIKNFIGQLDKNLI
ncbi:ArsR family transcriptional regulator [Natranaerovirga hydrolytica]|uniref:ArsR family transcriptional regulator n=1 Tax=Natranaerovirga hydrolytica TaxID=680378 RepID=A0A4R1N7U3_9FIRM|nr:metalloregulator ArsR/SmtB family transcription factor [Natranaerovirga hydrolytica]TCK98743.1 ArsR family transcriptional regulator [Natranaerovirga hydrolytica]